jgi:Aerobic-type carbon monoxide dehydrogenase, large subunit CoxL/CutL homologs
MKNQAAGTYVRSPQAHAKINSIDISSAEQRDGGVKALTGKEMAEAGTAGSICGWQGDFKKGDTMKEPGHPILVAEKVRQVGDAVALVTAEEKHIARDAVELIEIDYDILDAVVDPKAAVDDGAPQVHDDVS